MQNVLTLRQVVSFAACCAFSNYAFAQHDSLDLPNVVITANLLAQKHSQTGRNIVSIKGEAIKKLPVHSIDELIRYLPGIEVQQRGPQGSQSDITVRGGTFQQVLVMIDGVKLNDPNTGHFNMYGPIHPADIERIEILKGAASAIWGSEAVGGVVNIITKTFSGKTPAERFSARLSAGEYGLLNAGAGYNWSKNNTMVSGAVLTNNAKGQPLRGTKGFFHLTTANLALSQQLKRDWRMSARIATDFREFNAQNYYTSFASDTAQEEVNTIWGQLNLNKKAANGEFNFDIAYKKLRDQYSFSPSAAANDNTSKLFTIQTWYSARFNQTHGYTAGVQLQQKSIRSNDRGNHALWHGAFYTIFRHRLGSQAYLNESLRLDWDESYGAILIPQVNFAWTPSRLTVRFSAGQSFRDADFTERYNNYNKPLVTSGRIGNPGLHAEKSWNVEAGADYNFSAHFRISGTVFFRHYADLIDWANTPYQDMPRKDNLSPAGTYALAKNVEKVNTTGAELDIMYSKQLTENKSLLFTLGLTGIRSNNDDPVPSLYISSHAKFLVNFSAAYTFRQFSVSTTGIYKKRNEQTADPINAKITASYFVCNVKASYRLPGKFGKLFVQADNLFDKQYSDLLGSPMPGRWLSGGFEITL